jgi:hypothetical protein
VAVDQLEEARARRGLPQLHAAAPLAVVDVGDRRVFAFTRSHESGQLLVLVNFTEDVTRVDAGVLDLAGLDVAADALDPAARFDGRRPITLAPYQARWLVEGR